MLDGFVAIIPGVTAVPEREIVTGELLALLTMLMLPVALPATVGAKVTVSVALCPVANVAGTDKPLMPKPVPVTVA